MWVATVNTYLNLSMQSIPLGSSWEYTKHENAARKSSPQGPWAMPPRQGQSQLISPVSGLNAASWPSSPSCSASPVAGTGGCSPPEIGAPVSAAAPIDVSSGDVFLTSEVTGAGRALGLVFFAASRDSIVCETAVSCVLYWDPGAISTTIAINVSQSTDWYFI